MINEHSSWLIAVGFSEWGTYGNIYNKEHVDTLSNKAQSHTIPSISVDVSKVGHGITKTREANLSLNHPHKLKIALKSIKKFCDFRERERERKGDRERMQYI